MTDLHLPPLRLEGSEPLPESDCRALLATRTFGRVGVTSGGLPVIVPVRYGWTDACITFRTTARTELRAVATGDVLAFEVDAYDAVTGEGWSVLVLGRATVPATAVDHGVELSCELVSGRRFALETITPGPLVVGFGDRDRDATCRELDQSFGCEAVE